MSFQIILSALALKELESVVDWYNDCEDGLGKRFVEAINKRLLLLAETPHIFSVKESGYNEVLVEKFPYLLVYKIINKGKRVRIIHIIHTSQNPTVKK